MTELEFQKQVVRLQEQYGKTSYSTERMKLIWREVKEFSVYWFEEAVDEWLGNLRQPPLMPEVREAVAKERERLYTREKEERRRDDIAWFNNDDEITSICASIREMLKNSMKKSEGNE